ncbi:hypothetical protein PS676_00003 [Pseudomonas fluorescens]|nr:hypothetical protein PS676_00003 [Pseudomonas fluorescens]
MLNLTAVFGRNLLSPKAVSLVRLVLTATRSTRDLTNLMKRSYLQGEPATNIDTDHELFGTSTSFVDIDGSSIDVPIGAHLVSPRKFYLHHGIYLGNGNVAHYSGFSSSFRPGPVEVTNIRKFANGRPVWIFHEQGEFTDNEIVNRARSRIGECEYKIFSNNCEHFCNWCIRGENRSTQVTEYFHCPFRFLTFVAALDSCFIA